MGWQCHKMAASGAQSSYQDWRKSVTCRYYLHGLCKQGDSCQYAHDKTSSPLVMCKFYMKGKCRYGDECRFDHKRPDPVAMPPVSPQPQQPQIIQIVPAPQIISAPQPRPITHHQQLPPQAMPARMVPLHQKTMLHHGHGGPMVTHHSPMVSMPMPMGGGMMTMAPHHMTMAPHMVAAVTSQMNQIHMQDYVNAAAFVPGQPYQNPIPPSYLNMAHMGMEMPPPISAPSIPPPPRPPVQKPPTPDIQQQRRQSPIPSDAKKQNSLCPFNIKGTCRYGVNCMYLHGQSCDLCGEYCLHPTDKTQNKDHRAQCMADHEKNMQVAFAFQRSKDIACGICMEIILEKSSPKDRKFGLLSGCNHPYCLACIRKWRMAKQYEKKVVRGCPTCRVASHFVTPSDFWVEESAEKDKIVEKYKQALSIKACKYFDQGRGTCPFGAECFYLHAYQDGSKEDRTKVRKYNNADGKLRTFRALQLWDFFEERDNRLLDWSSDDEDDWFLYYDWSDEFDYYSDFEDELWSDYFDFYGNRSDDSDNGSREAPSNLAVPVGQVSRSRNRSENATTQQQQQPQEQPQEQRQEEGDANDGDDESDGDANHGAAQGEGNAEATQDVSKDKVGVEEAKKDEEAAEPEEAEANDEEEEFEDCLSDDADL